MKGKACLVGAGPGDPELLTTKAVNRLRTADVVLHDALVSDAVLALASPGAHILNVGKRCGHKCVTQQEINGLLIEFARVGRFVVRLKSGDPLIFGRGGEEIDALREAGIEVEVVPGVTAAVAAAASVQISLTDRRFAERLMLVTAHHAPGRPGADWRHLISARTALAVYMPGPPAHVVCDLIQAGVNRDTPCVVVSRVSLPDERSYKTTLRELCDAQQLPLPSLLLVGEAAANARTAEKEVRTFNDTADLVLNAADGRPTSPK